jgi:hypothetical protein
MCVIFGQYAHEMCRCRSVRSYRPFQKLVMGWTVESGCDDERRGRGGGGFKSCLYLARARKNNYSDDFRVRCPAIEVICDGVVGHEDIQEQAGSWCDDVLRQPCHLVRTRLYIKPSV